MGNWYRLKRWVSLILCPYTHFHPMQDVELENPHAFFSLYSLWYSRTLATVLAVVSSPASGIADRNKACVFGSFSGNNNLHSKYLNLVYSSLLNHLWFLCLLSAYQKEVYFILILLYIKLCSCTLIVFNKYFSIFGVGILERNNDKNKHTSKKNTPIE